jgi:hypothetical protein
MPTRANRPKRIYEIGSSLRKIARLPIFCRGQIFADHSAQGGVSSPLRGRVRLAVYTHKAQRKFDDKRSLFTRSNLRPQQPAVVDPGRGRPDVRSNRHRRCLKLWTRILSSASESDLYTLKGSSRGWPAAIRARFDHEWSHHERDTLRWRTDSGCRQSKI